jgi:hypothetical protein
MQFTDLNFLFPPILQSEIGPILSIFKNHMLTASERALTLWNDFNATNHTFKYKHAILLFKLYNQTEQSSDLIDLNLMQILTSTQSTFKISSKSNFKIGNNILCKRLSCINEENSRSTIDTFKINCKEKFF